MSIAAFILGAVSLVFTITALFGTFVPGVPSWLMAIVSLLAPLASLIGMVLGGVALSRAREENDGTGLATGALVTNVIAFLPAIIVGVACGACNMMCASMGSGSHAPRDRQQTPAYWAVDAGPGFDPAAPRPGTVAPPPLDPAAVDPSAVEPGVDPSAVDPSAVDPSAVDPSAGEPADPAQPPPM